MMGATATISMATQPAAAEEGLTLRQVMLSSGGVGYFEYSAKVQGDVDLPLTVRLDQIDDVLKSVVVFDEHGGMGEVRLPGKAAASEAFRDLPFGPEALGSEAALLEAMRGARVSVTIAGGTREGRILSVTAEVVERGVKRHRLALASGGAVASLILEEASVVRLLDPALSAQLEEALSALLAQKDRGRRTLTIHSSGQGEREVHVGHVVSVPLWKSTYRLMLPADTQEKKARLIGLAVVENQSGEPFRGVDLTLISGNPVTFRQALYQAYYVKRPEIPVEVAGRVLPRLDEGAVKVADKSAPSPSRFGGMAPSFETFGVPGVAMPPAPPGLAGSAEEATQIIFHIPEPVTLEAGEEALIPILDRTLPALRVALFQPDVDAHHPIDSVLLDNDSETGLPPGVVTTYEQRGTDVASYLGDARLAALPAGERRLVSFGVDTKVRIDRDEHAAQTIALASIAGGTLRIERRERRTTDYAIVGAAREPRTVMVEEPRLPDFTLEPPTGAAVEVTAGHYRARVEVPAGAAVTLSLTQVRPLFEEVVVTNLPSEVLAVYATSGEIPAAVRAVLTRLRAARALVEEREAAVKVVQDELAKIREEQARIRENLKVIPAGSALVERYLAALSEQEDRIAALHQRLADAQRAEREAREALDQAIRSS